MKNIAIAFAMSVVALSASAYDNDDADEFAKTNGCTKCHTVEKKKDGPAYRDVAAKFRGMPDAEAKLTHHLTSGEKVKFPDGHEEAHKKVKKSTDEEIKQFVTWVKGLEGGKKY